MARVVKSEKHRVVAKTVVLPVWMWDRLEELEVGNRSAFIRGVLMDYVDIAEGEPYEEE